MSALVSEAAQRWRQAAVFVAIALTVSCDATESTAPSHKSYESNPIDSMWVTVDHPATNAFLDEFQRFATRRGFKFRKSTVSPDARNFSIDLQGQGLRVISINDAEVYNIYFYLAKEKPASTATITTWKRDLMTDLGRISGVRFPSPSERPLRRWER